MKISTLIHRENFKKITEITLSNFFSELNRKEYYINFKRNSFKLKKSSSVQNWYCNPLINSIFIKRVDKSVFNSINGEYNFNPIKPWKSLIQRIYLFLSQSRLLRTLMSTYLLEISPKIENPETKLIIGGNKKLRLIDIKNKEVFVILKNGFKSKYIERDRFIRDNFIHLPLPKIIKTGKTNFWYSEEYIVGVPPNRLKQKNANEIVEKAILDIRKLNSITKKEIDVESYLNNLKAKISLLIKEIPSIDNKLKNKLIQIIEVLANELIKSKKNKIFISQCHGDFHLGNIITNGKRYWILDWENSVINQIGYDLFIYLIDSRTDLGFSKKFISLINFDFDITKKHMINYWPELINDNNVFKREYLLFFLLEEIIFYLDELNNKLFKKTPFAIKIRLYEFKTILNKLNLAL
jgi:thiamine kinase-like enzyme